MMQQLLLPRAQRGEAVFAGFCIVFAHNQPDLQARAILTRHLAGCGGGAPSMLKKQRPGAEEQFFPANIEGALPEGPARSRNKTT